METLHRLSSVLFETVQQTNSASLTFCEQGRTVMDTLMVQSKNRVGEALEYYEYLLSIGDKRVENWGLMQSPVPTILITMAYLLSKAGGHVEQFLYVRWREAKYSRRLNAKPFWTIIVSLKPKIVVSEEAIQYKRNAEKLRFQRLTFPCKFMMLIYY